MSGNIAKVFSSVFLPITACCFLVACKEKAPSESTVKAQIKQSIAACKVITLSDFKKQNGFPEGENSYLVAVSYTLNYSPTKEMKRVYSEFIAKDKEMHIKLDDIKDRFPTVLEKIRSFDCDGNVRETYYRAMLNRIKESFHGVQFLSLYAPPEFINNPDMANVSKSISEKTNEINDLIDAADDSINKGDEAFNAIAFLSSLKGKFSSYLSAVISLDNIIGDTHRETLAKNAVDTIENEIKNYPKGNQDLQTAKQCIASRDDYIKKNIVLLNDNRDFPSKVYQFEENSEYKIRSMLFKGCAEDRIENSITYPLLGKITSGSKLEGYMSEVEQSYENKLKMVNSDNGWVLVHN